MSPQTEQIQNENIEESQFHFIGRVTGLPVVHTAIEKAKYVYDGTTTRLPIIEQVRGGIYQSIVPQILNTASPLSKPLTAIDGYACKGLDVLEKKIPIIKETPEDIITTSKQMIDSRIITPVTGIVQNIDGLIDQALTASEATVDRRFCNHQENQENQESIQRNSKIQRVQKIGNKLKNSAYDTVKSKTPKDVSKLLSIDIVKQATSLANNQAIRVNESFQVIVDKIHKGDIQIQKKFEEYIKDLKSSTESALDKIMSMSSSKVRETTVSVLLSLSSSVTQFTTKASQTFSEMKEKMKSKQMEDINLSQLINKFEQNLSSLKKVSNMLLELSSKYQILSKFTAQKNEEVSKETEEIKVEKVEENETEKTEKTENS